MQKNVMEEGKKLKEKREESFKSKLVIWQNSPTGTCLKD
jgi:hypothetical protein